MTLLRRSRRNPENSWRLKQRAASPGRYYGGGGTIHNTTYLDVETHNGEVVAVWFRCQMLPFTQVEVDGSRALMMTGTPRPHPRLTGVELLDCE